MTGVDPFEERIQQNRIARNNRIYERQQIARRQRSPQEYVGYDAATGLHRLRGAEGDRLVPSITTGALESGAIVRSGPGSVDGLQSAQPLVFESANRFFIPEVTAYVGDEGNGAIRTIDFPSGNVGTFAIDGPNSVAGDDGVIGTAWIGRCEDLCVVDGRVFYGDVSGASIREISGGIVSTVVGKFDESGDLDGLGTDARIGPSEGILPVWGTKLAFSDRSNGKLKTYDLLTLEVATLATDRDFLRLVFDSENNILFSCLSFTGEIFMTEEDGTTSLFLAPNPSEGRYLLVGKKTYNGRFLAVQYRSVGFDPFAALFWIDSTTAERTPVFLDQPSPLGTSSPQGAVVFKGQVYISGGRGVKRATKLDEYWAGSEDPGLVDGGRQAARFGLLWNMVF